MMGPLIQGEDHYQSVVSTVSFPVFLGKQHGIVYPMKYPEAEMWSIVRNLIEI